MHSYIARIKRCTRSRRGPQGQGGLVSADDSVLAAGGPLHRRFGKRVSRGASARPRYALTPLLATHELVFNTHRPPFADKRLRRAANEALDRDALATAIGGLPTDQILPPGMPGFRDARLYPLHGRDLRAARRLAAGRARPAVLYVCRSPRCRAVGELVRDDLARIGIRLTVRSFSNTLAQTRAHPPGLGFDLLLTRISSKYPDPVDFLRRALQGNGGARASATLRRAKRLDGAPRAATMGAADVNLMRSVVPVAPLATGAVPELFSSRIGCQTAQPVYYGVDLAAMCLGNEE